MTRQVRKVLLLLPLLLLAASAASAQQVRLAAALNGGNETPNVINTGALGTASVTVDVPNRELVVGVRVFNLPTTAVGGHIHVGAPGTAGPIIFDFNVPAASGDFPVNLRLGPAQLRPQPAQGIRTFDDAVEAVTGGNSYVNIHSTQFPGGEIRGQLIPLQ